MKSSLRSGASEWEGEALARLRQGLFRLLSSALRYPQEEPLRVLAETIQGLEEEYLGQFAFYESWARLQRALGEEVNLETLRQEHVRLFSVGPGGALCPPNESSYLVLPGQRALYNVELDREYAKLGISISPHHKGLPDDVTVEMEAMAFLCEKEAEAWRSGDLESVHQVLMDECNFLRQHLGRWIPTFAGLVKKASPDTLYSLVADAANAFITHDLDLLDSMTEARTRE